MRRRAVLRSTTATRLALILFVYVCVVMIEGAALAADGDHVDLSPSAEAEAFRSFSKPPTGYARVVGTLAFGDGLRFNNPYRLSTQLGQTAESLSLTSAYIDLGAGFALGPPNGLQHGAALRFSAALSGVSQQVLTPSYFVAVHGPRRTLAFGRAGTPILLSPDAGVGAELGAGIGYFLTAKVGLFGEVVGDLFYGAGTFDVKYAVYPVLSAQLGLIIDAEILP